MGVRLCQIEGEVLTEAQKEEYWNYICQGILAVPPAPWVRDFLTKKLERDKKYYETYYAVDGFRTKFRLFTKKSRWIIEKGGKNKGGIYEVELKMFIMKKVDSKIKHLRLNPLSVAKYFYEREIELNSTMQDLLYLAYLEVLKKEKALLFEEEFQAWRAGPTLNSVFYAMDNYFEKNKTYEGLFDKISSIKNKIILEHLENVYQQYRKYETKKRQLNFAEKAKNKAWKITRKPLNDSLKSRAIKLTTIAQSL